MEKEHYFCCDIIFEYISDPSLPFGYKKVWREYFFRMKGNILIVDYCPWCGIKLPQALRNEFFDTLEREFGIEADLDILNDPNLPEEFKTDEWWKKRGL